MHKHQIIEMLSVMADMVKNAMEGTKYVEISTYLQNHIPGIEPEYIEVFRDVLNPIMNRPVNRLRYNLETGEIEEI